MPHGLMRGIEHWYRLSLFRNDINTEVLLNRIVLMPCRLTRGIELYLKAYIPEEYNGFLSGYRLSVLDESQHKLYLET